jgi:hypothetical protein
VTFENLFDDGGDLFPLENAAIGRTGQKPQPRDQDGTVLDEAALLASQNEAADETVEETSPAGRRCEPHRGRRADESIEIDVVSFALQLRLDLKQAPDPFGKRKTPDHESVSPEHGLDGEQATLLRGWHVNFLNDNRSVPSS